MPDYCTPAAGRQLQGLVPRLTLHPVTSTTRGRIQLQGLAPRLTLHPVTSTRARVMVFSRPVRAQTVNAGAYNPGTRYACAKRASVRDARVSCLLNNVPFSFPPHTHTKYDVCVGEKRGDVTKPGRLS